MFYRHRRGCYRAKIVFTDQTIELKAMSDFHYGKVVGFVCQIFISKSWTQRNLMFGGTMSGLTMKNFHLHSFGTHNVVASNCSQHVMIIQTMKVQFFTVTAS